jgi:hypothetical protein
MAKAGKKHTHRTTKPPLPSAMEVERLRPLAKRFREEYERNAAEAADMAKAREAIDRALKPASVPTPAPTPTFIAPKTWLYKEVECLREQSAIYIGISKADMVRVLDKRMQAAVRAGLVRRSWGVRYIANYVKKCGAWPVR